MVEHLASNDDTDVVEESCRRWITHTTKRADRSNTKASKH